MIPPQLIAAGISALAPAIKDAASGPPVPNQRSDGYSMGGMLDGRSSHDMLNAATGGAYGGAFSQSYIDGSNWTVSTGNSKAIGGGTSGGNGGLSPTMSTYQGGIAPAAHTSVPSGPSGVFQPVIGQSGLGIAAGGDTTLILLGVGILAIILLRR